MHMSLVHSKACRGRVWLMTCALASVHVQGARETLQGYSSSIDQDLALLRSGELKPGSPEQAAVMVG